MGQNFHHTARCSVWAPATFAKLTALDLHMGCCCSGQGCCYSSTSCCVYLQQVQRSAQCSCWLSSIQQGIGHCRWGCEACPGEQTQQLSRLQCLHIHKDGNGALIYHAGYICLPGGSKSTVSSCQPHCRPSSGQADALTSVYCCERSPHTFYWRRLSFSCHASSVCAVLSHGESCTVD